MPKFSAVDLAMICFMLICLFSENVRTVLLTASAINTKNDSVEIAICSAVQPLFVYVLVFDDADSGSAPLSLNPRLSVFSLTMMELTKDSCRYGGQPRIPPIVLLHSLRISAYSYQISHKGIGLQTWYNGER